MEMYSGKRRAGRRRRGPTPPAGCISGSAYLALQICQKPLDVRVDDDDELESFVKLANT